MITLADGRLHVAGAMTMATAASLLQGGLSQLAQASGGVDLSAVAEVDSSGLAVLLEWARELGRPLAVVGAPASLVALAALYDLDDLLGLVPAASA